MNGLIVRGLLAVTLLGAVSTCGRADERSQLEETRRLREVAAQALAEDMRIILKEADRLKKEPDKASDILRGAIKRLEKDDVLSSDKRIALLLDLKTRLAGLEGKPARNDNDTELPAKPAEGKSADNLKRDLDYVKAMQLEGKHAEAGRLAAELAKRYPDSPAAQQMRERTRMSDAIGDAQHVRNDKAKGATGVVRSNERSSIPESGDYVLPKDWLAKSAKRKAKYGNSLVAMTPQDKAIVDLLNGVTSEALSVKDMPFEEVVKLLQKELGIPLVVNKPAMDEMKIDYSSTITVNLPRQVSRRTLLRRVLGELGLTYFVKNGQLEVTSVLRAQNELVTRFFDVGDLVKGGGGLAGLGGGQPGQDPIQAMIDFIQQTVDPGSWQKNGGPGTISYFAPTKTLIVRNTAEVINAMGPSRSR